jgi:hypothetical protein
VFIDLSSLSSQIILLLDAVARALSLCHQEGASKFFSSKVDEIAFEIPGKSIVGALK